MYYIYIWIISFKHIQSIMIKPATILLGFIFLTASCNEIETRESKNKQTPKILKNEDESYTESRIFSQRNGEEFIESIYADLVEKTPKLNDLENKIDKLHEGLVDSTKIFDNYNRKNVWYYDSAKRQALKIKDSVLKKKIYNLILKSQLAYDGKIEKHKQLLSQIDDKNLKLEDLHVILKITSTLPVIEKYQQENLPSIKSVNNYSAELDKTIKQMEKIVKE